MSEEKDDLKSINVYKFNNTKEKWHEFALKFRVIADSRGYWEIINGTMVPPDKLVTITVTAEDRGEALKEKKEKLKARAANKMGFRDLVLSTEGISLTIVENAVSEELTKGDLKKAWERLERRWNLKTREDKVEVYTRFLNFKLENTKQNLGIIFEFTAPGTPQQNSIAERRIPTLMGRARAMLIQVGLESKYKEEFWCEVISTVTMLDTIMVRPERTKPPHTLFYGKDAKYMRCLRTFGEIAVVAIHEGGK